MIGIVVVGHGRIASEMCAAVEHVLGRQSLLSFLDVLDSDHVEQLDQRLAAMIRAVDVGHGVLILADMFGGTPCNMAVAHMRPGKTELISGVNLPALIKAVSLRRKTDDPVELARAVVVSGQQYICLASEFMDGGKDG